jgi:hypothetical protein
MTGDVAQTLVILGVICRQAGLFEQSTDKASAMHLQGFWLTQSNHPVN